ncbi:MAG: GIY-YIG nuclease family protein [bacterium]
MYYVYILKLSNRLYYVGYSSNLKNRIKAHKEGSISSTKNLRPLILVYYSAFTNQRKAVKFERCLKSSSGFAFRNKRLV